MSRTMTQATTLISVALRAAADPGVQFEVTHVEGVQVDDPTENPTQASDWALGESFVSYGRGTRLELRTRRTGRAHLGPNEAIPDIVKRAISEDIPVVEDLEAAQLGGRVTTWRGGTSGYPDFFFNFADKLDILLTLRDDDEQWSPADSESLSVLLSQVAKAAGVSVELPITFVRFPSAGFNSSQRLSASEHDSDPLLARSVSLRLTVGLDQSDPRARLAFLVTLADMAAGRYELRVADRRFGSISGQWVLISDPAVGRSKAQDAPEPTVSTTDQGRSRAALLTILGPSRQGAVASVTAMLRTVGMHPRAVTCLSLHDVAFCHFEIDLTAKDGGREATWTQLDRNGNLSDLIERLAPEMANHRAAERHAARDYLYLRGNVFTPPPGPSGVWHPVWSSWEVRDAPAVTASSGTVEQLRDRLADHELVEDCQPEYYRFRRASSAQIVERVKFRIRLETLTWETVQDDLAAICREAQHAMRLPGGWAPPDDESSASLPRSSAQRPRLVSLRVAPRERWLGTWLDDPR